MKALKQYIPDPKLIPFIVLAGGIGAVVVMKALPVLVTKISEMVPTIQKPKAAA
jgi:hypothetical protein